DLEGVSTLRSCPLGQLAARRGRGDSVGWLCRRDEPLAANALCRTSTRTVSGIGGTFKQGVGAMANRTMKRDKLSHTTEESVLASANGDGQVKQGKLPKKTYERELLRLQEELVKMAEWIKDSGSRLVVIFEGRDAAGKGGTIKRMTEYLNPRIARI